MNKNNVFSFGYMPWSRIYNLPHNIKNIFSTIKWGFQRATKGYCDYDIWDLDTFYGNLFHDSLIDLRDNFCSYPEGTDEVEWYNILTEMADNFYNCLEANGTYTNPIKYSDTYSKIICSEDEPYITHSIQRTPEQNELVEKWHQNEEANAKSREDNKDAAFNLMKKWFFELWG